MCLEQKEKRKNKRDEEKVEQRESIGKVKKGWKLVGRGCVCGC